MRYLWGLKRYVEHAGMRRGNQTQCMRELVRLREALRSNGIWFERLGLNNRTVQRGRRDIHYSSVLPSGHIAEWRTANWYLADGHGNSYCCVTAHA